MGGEGVDVSWCEVFCGFSGWEMWEFLMEEGVLESRWSFGEGQVQVESFGAVSFRMLSFLGPDLDSAGKIEAVELTGLR